MNKTELKLLTNPDKWFIAGSLPVKEWFKHSACKKVINILNPNQDDDTMFVGGCIRDSLLHEDNITDIDIATKLRPEQVAQILQENDIKYSKTYLKYGIIDFNLDKYNFSVTTLREDLPNDNDTEQAHLAQRHNQIIYCSKWTEDAKRRDFTINAIYCDKSGNLFDPQNGIHDLSHSIIKIIGNAHHKFVQDPIRILRIIRFYSIIKKSQIQYDCISNIQKNKKMLISLSSYQKWKEIKKILLAINAVPALEFIEYYNLSELLFGQKKLQTSLLKELIWLETTAIKFPNISPNHIRRLAVIYHNSTILLLNSDNNHKTQATNYNIPNHLPSHHSHVLITDFLDLSKPELLELQKIHNTLPLIINNQEDKYLRKLCYLVNKDTVISCLLINWALHREQAKQGLQIKPKNNYWLTLLQNIIDFNTPKFPLTGKDLIAQKYSAGEKLGELLEFLKQIWIESDFTLTAKELYDIAKQKK